LNNYSLPQIAEEDKRMTTNPKRQPAIFLPHGGGPCFFMDWTWGSADTWNATQHFLEGLAATLPEQPKAIVVISGHWEEPAFTASASPAPQLIFDYTGFPEHTYRLTWPAPGDPEPALHLAAGRALAPLRDEGILLVASGMSFHNLRAYLRPETLQRSRDFDEWLTRAVESPAPERDAWLKAWRSAPSAVFSHPREEHLAPLFVAAGAGGSAPGKRIFNDEPMGAAISAYRFDG
jgi:aromatic ring-opening dioxygenase catalytic subunit (LigB family)